MCQKYYALQYFRVLQEHKEWLGLKEKKESEGLEEILDL